MAIQTYSSESLAETAANQPKLSEITTGDDLANLVQTRNPVVATGTERSPDAPPEPQVEGQSEKKGAKHDVQSRINELTRLRKEAEEFAEEEYNNRLRAERRIGELEEQLKTQPEPPKAPVTPQQEELKEPNEADFKDITSFTKAWSEYTLKLADRRVAEARQQERVRAAVEVENAELQKRVAAAKEDFDDFERVITNASRDKQIPVHVERAIRESEYGAHLAYHLAKNPDDESRILSLTPAKALLELGKIEDRYARKTKVTSTTEAPKAKPTIETSRAPAPVSSIKAESGTVITNSAEARNYQEYRRLRMEEKRHNRR